MSATSEHPFGIDEVHERNLLRRAKGGDRAAQSELLVAFEPGIRGIVARLAPGSARYADLLQEGGLALLAAVEPFDEARACASLATPAPGWRAPSRGSFSAADREVPGLASEELPNSEGEGADGREGGDEGMQAAHRRSSSRPRQMAEFFGGKTSGRDPYLEHPAAEFAALRLAFERWLEENRGWSLEERGWRYLCDGEPELLLAARAGETAAFAKLEQKYAILRASFGLEPRSHSARGEVIGPDRRAAALAEIIAHAVICGTLGEQLWRVERAAAGMPVAIPAGFSEVAEFRQRFLADRLLGPDELVSWIEAQAAREGPPAPAYLRLPLTEEDVCDLASLELSGSPAAHRAWLARAGERLGQGERELPGHPEAPLALTYSLPDGRAEIIRIRSDGVLAQLKGVVDTLLAHFDGWLFEDALAFVLAGVAPPLDQLRGRTRRGLYGAASRITLDCDLRITPAELADFYERLRRRHLSGRDRPMGEKGLALACFIEMHWCPGTSWGELRVLWNDAYPQYASDSTNQFGTEARASWERLTGELWPTGSRAQRKLREDIAAARVRRTARLPQLLE